MSVVAINVHGYNTEDYRKTVGKLDLQFESLGVYSEVMSYHADNVRQARKMNPVVAKELADKISWHQSNGDVVIVTAHSNGNTILRMAWDEYMAAPDVAVCIQPALPSDINPSPMASAVRVCWNPEDDVVRLGKLLTWVTKLVSPAWALKRNWGQMGYTGYTGQDDNVTNENTMLGPVKAEGHSGIFYGLASTVVLPLLVRWALSKAASCTCLEVKRLPSKPKRWCTKSWRS